MSRNHVKLNARRWAHVRRQVFKRDGYRCRQCGKPGRLEAHHEPPLRAGDDRDPHDPAGIMTLCRNCHIERHRPDDQTPGRADWLALVDEIAYGSSRIERSWGR